MKAFYKEIVQKLLAAEASENLPLSPLEAVVFLDCCEETDRLRIPAYRMQQIIRALPQSTVAPMSSNLCGVTLNTLISGTFRVFRKELTGVTQYRFYHQDRLLGTGSAGIGRGFPLVLRCTGLFLNSSMDPDQTIVPGCSRKIIDADNAAAIVARLTYLKDGLHKLQLNWDDSPMTIQIQTQERTHLCYVQGKLIAAIMPLAQVQYMDEWVLSYCLKAEIPLTDETALLLMSFPLLQIGR